MMERKNKNRYMDTDGMNELRMAVVEKALRDYADLKRTKNPRKLPAMNLLMAWFHDPVFSFWCSQNPDRLLRQMDKNIAEGKVFAAALTLPSHE